MKALAAVRDDGDVAERPYREEDAEAPDQPAWDLRRARSGRVLVGVCAGLGRHTGVDPLVYRVTFALLTVSGGIGVLLYLMGWLLLPAEYAAAAPVERLLRRRVDPRAFFPLSLVILALSLFPAGALDRFVLLSVLLVGVLTARAKGIDVVAAVRALPARFHTEERPPRQPPYPPTTPAPGTPGGPPPWWSGPAGHPPTPPAGTRPYPPFAPPSGTPDPAGTPATATYPTTYPTAAYAPQVGRTARGQPYGPAPPHAAPGSGPPPHGATARPAPRRRRRPAPLTVVALAAAATVAGALALLGGVGVISAPVPLILAAVLITLGLGLTVGTWYGGGPTLVLAGLMVTFALVATTVTVDVGDNAFTGAVGDVTWRPTSAAQAARPYRLSAGDGRLILSDLPSDRDAYDVDARVAFGELRVEIPRDATVDLDTHIGSGSVTFPTSAGESRTEGGTGARFRRVIPPGPGEGDATSGPEGGREAENRENDREDEMRINLTIRLGTGEVVIVRAPT